MLVDFELVKRAQGGDQAAFSEIVIAYRRRILGTIARLISRPDDVEDVGQDVFVRLWFSLNQLRNPEVFEPWLYRLMVNAAHDYLRRQRRRHESLLADLSEQSLHIADADASFKFDRKMQHHADVRERVEALLETVSPEDRILLLLKEVEGLSLRELAKIYRVSANILKQRLFRARQRVLKALERSEDGGGKSQ